MNTLPSFSSFPSRPWRAALGLLILCAPVQADELLLSGFNSDTLTRHSDTTGLHLGEFGPASLNGPLGIALGPDGHVWVCSEESNQVLRFELDTGALVDAIIENDPSTPEDETGGLMGPSGLLFRPDGNVLVGSFDNDAVLEYDGRTGAFIRFFVTSGGGLLNGPDSGMAIGPDGHVYVPSFYNRRIKRYHSSTGAFIDDFIEPPTGGLQRPRGILFPGDGFAYVVSEGNNRVNQYDEITGALVTRLVWNDPGTAVDETGGLNKPTGIAIGPDGRLYVSSLQTNSVFRYELADGSFVDEFVAPGSGGNNLPVALQFVPGIAKRCTTSPNSVGDGALITAYGSTWISADNFTLSAQYAPPGSSGLFFYGAGEAALPLGGGTLCVSGPHYRLPTVTVQAAGLAQYHVDFMASAITAGSTWYFQFWYRDPAGGAGAQHNTSDSLRATFTP